MIPVVHQLLAFHLSIIFCLSATLFFGMVIFNFSSAEAAERGRVRVQNGSVYTDRGTMIRGSTMAVLYGIGNAKNQSYWQYLNKTLKLNAVRLGVKTGQIGRNVRQQLETIDHMVASAGKNNMYVMINNSIQPGSYNLSQLREFWSVVAPRYANRTHVFYEMTNEPVNGGPVWGNAAQYTEKVRSELKSIYDIMRRGAPNTHIVMFTAPNLFPNCATYAEMISKVKGIDWKKTSVGFHHYQGTQRFGETNLRCLRQKYPLIMTETNYWMRPDVNNLRTALNLYEKLDMSWFSLDGRGDNRRLQYEIIPQLNRDGHYWEVAN